MGATPTVSVVVVNHDYGRYLAEAIGSVLGQTLAPHQVVVADDGSTDGSHEVIRAFGGAVHPVLGAHAGFCANLARGVAAADGDLVALLDADDVAEPELLERVVAVFAADPSVVQVSAAWRCVDGAGRPLRTRPFRATVGDARRLQLRFGRYAVAPTSGLCYPRPVLERLLPIEPIEGVDTADTYLAVGAAFLGPVGAVREPSFRYRIHGANMQVGRSDVDLLRRQRRATLELTRRWAAAEGVPCPLPAVDPELAALDAVAGEAVPWRRRVRALVGSVREVVALRRPVADGVLTAFSRAVMLFVPAQGRRVIRLGPGEFVRVVLLRRPARRGLPVDR